MSQHLQPIYDVWGGNAEAMAADIGELGVTVRQWRNRGDIPSRAWPKIITAAADKGAEIRLQDFLPDDVKSALPPHSLDARPADASVSADKSAENICLAERRDGEGGHGHPFTPPSSVISSQTSAPPPSSPDSPASSAGSEVTA